MGIYFWQALYLAFYMYELIKSLPQSYEVGAFIIPILQMRKQEAQTDMLVLLSVGLYK